jgi:hypothetical protein
VNIEEEREPLSSQVKRLEGEVGPHAHHPLLNLSVFEQLKHRNVFRVAVLYLVVCWLILDPLHVVFHMLDFPIWANQLVVMLMAVEQSYLGTIGTTDIESLRRNNLNRHGSSDLVGARRRVAQIAKS